MSIVVALDCMHGNCIMSMSVPKHRVFCRGSARTKAAKSLAAAVAANQSDDWLLSTNPNITAMITCHPIAITLDVSCENKSCYQWCYFNDEFLIGWLLPRVRRLPLCPSMRCSPILLIQSVFSRSKCLGLCIHPVRHGEGFRFCNIQMKPVAYPENNILRFLLF